MSKSKRQKALQQKVLAALAAGLEKKARAAHRKMAAHLAVEWDVGSRLVRRPDGTIALAIEDRGYAKAIEWAEKGAPTLREKPEDPKRREKPDPTLLLNRLRAGMPLTAATELGALALYIEQLLKLQKREGPGAPGDPAMRDCVRFADMLLGLRPPRGGKPRGEFIEYARRLYEDWTGHAIDPVQLKARMNRPRSRHN